MGTDKNNKSPELVFLPLGGVGEIGMNLYAYGVGSKHSKKWIIVDLGITFPTEREPGVDVILPDITFLENERSNILGIFITHAHEDHFGAIIDLWPQLEVPVYMTPFAHGLLSAKLHEYGMEHEINLKRVEPSSRFDVGPFNIEFVTMSHSIPEANGIAIRTEQGLTFHTGDWKCDYSPVLGSPIDDKRLKELGQEGVDVLICDSTNALSEGFSDSESEVAEQLKAIFKSTENRIAVTTFASNVARVKSVYDAAKEANRHVVIVGRALKRVVTVAKETGYLNEKLEFLNEDEFGYLPKDKVVALCTGSQGEPRAAMSRIANDSHPEVTLSKGDLVIFSSKTIPGNENSVASVQNALARQGLEIITDKDKKVHVSGHPNKGELAKLYDWLKPKAMLPMHGEDMHLQAHIRFAESKGIKDRLIARNGQMARILPGELQIIDDVPVGRLYRDGDLIIREEDPAVRERRKIAYTGIAIISVVLSKNGEVASEPNVRLVGMPNEDEDGELFENIVLDEVEGILVSIPRPRRKDGDLVSEAVRRGVRGCLNKLWGKKPICEVIVTYI